MSCICYCLYNHIRIYSYTIAVYLDSELCINYIKQYIKSTTSKLEPYSTLCNLELPIAITIAIGYTISLNRMLSG